MDAKKIFIGVVAAVVALAVVGALLTPTEQAVAANPYVVGGELEVPSSQPSQASSPDILVALVAVAAIAVGALVAYKTTRS
ncbi:MAG: hypothetical protein ABWW69_07880 [Pyrodictiaceae archaeon]